MSWIKFSLPGRPRLSQFSCPSNEAAFVASNIAFVICLQCVSMCLPLSALRAFITGLDIFADCARIASYKHVFYNFIWMHQMLKHEFQSFLCSFQFCDLSSFIEGALCCCSLWTRTQDWALLYTSAQSRGIFSFLHFLGLLEYLGVYQNWCKQMPPIVLLFAIFPNSEIVCADVIQRYHHITFLKSSNFLVSSNQICRKTSVTL